MSEMAMTIKGNLPLIRQFSRSILQETFVEDLVSPFEAMEETLVKLDNKDKNNNEAASRQEVINVLRTIDENINLDQAMSDAYNLAGPLFNLSVQLFAIQTLLQNPQDFAEKLSRTPANEHFHHNPTPKRMRKYLLVKRHRPANRGVFIWDYDDDDDDNDHHMPSAGEVAQKRFQRREPQRQPARTKRTTLPTWGDAHKNEPEAGTSCQTNARPKNRWPPPAAKGNKQSKVLKIQIAKSSSQDDDSSEDEKDVPPPPRKKQRAATKQQPKASAAQKTSKAQKRRKAESSSDDESDILLKADPTPRALCTEKKQQPKSNLQKRNKLQSSEDELSCKQIYNQPDKQTNKQQPKTLTPIRSKAAKTSGSSSSSSSSSSSEGSDAESPAKKTPQPIKNAVTSSSAAGTSKGKTPLEGQSVGKNVPQKPTSQKEDDDPWKGLSKAAKAKTKEKKKTK